MDDNNLKDFSRHLDNRLDRLEEKLDTYTDRLARAETSIEWLRNSTKALYTLVSAALAGLAGSVLNYLVGK